MAVFKRKYSMYAGAALGAYRRVRAGMRIGKRMYNAYRNRRRTSGDNVGVTAERDYRIVYKKKSMPKAKKKQWKKFVKKVNAVLAKDLGTKSVLFNNTVNRSATGLGQSIALFHLYGGNGTDNILEAGCRDIGQIFGQDVEIAAASKAMFASGVL